MRVITAHEAPLLADEADDADVMPLICWLSLRSNDAASSSRASILAPLASDDGSSYCTWMCFCGRERCPSTGACLSSAALATSLARCSAPSGCTEAPAPTATVDSSP